VDKLTDKVSELTREVVEVKTHTQVTADRIEAVAYATGEVTPPPRVVESARRLKSGG